MNERVAGQWNSVTSNLGVTALVNQIADGLQRRSSIGDVRLDEGQDLLRSGVDLDEGSVVDLAQAEELESLLDLRADAVDT
jgi:hypothetical protein